MQRKGGRMRTKKVKEEDDEEEEKKKEKRDIQKYKKNPTKSLGNFSLI